MDPYYADANVTLYHGDCVAVLTMLPDASVDAIVTDPPYALTSVRDVARGFMNAEWDNGRVAFSPELWTEVLRVAKPGAHLVAFGGTRTYHRLACAIEDGGWRIKDMVAWLHGQGFPKSHNLGNGRGTALKPAHEPICLAMKPLTGTYVETVGQWGTGALNIDATRVESDGSHKRPYQPANNGRRIFGQHAGFMPTNADGRWPPNLLLSHSAACGDVCADDCPVAELDWQSGTLTSGYMAAGTHRANQMGYNGAIPDITAKDTYADTGGASRFFPTFHYFGKADRSERDRMWGDIELAKGGANGGVSSCNTHPT